MKLFVFWLMYRYPINFYIISYCWTFAAVVITIRSTLHLFFTLKECLKQFVCKRK